MRSLKYLRSDTNRWGGGHPSPAPAVSSAKTVRRTLVELRPYHSLDADSKSAIGYLHAACQRLATTSASGLVDNTTLARLCTGTLRTFLSERATEQNGLPSYESARIGDESRAADLHLEDILTALSEPNTFPQLLNCLAASCGVQTPSVRTTQNGLVADGNGVAILFPFGRIVPTRLKVIAQFTQALDNSETPACYRALVTQVALLNLHPLRDGNGRVSRVVFNILLRQGYPGLNAYIPVYEQRRHAPYAFETALRSAEIHGEWVGLSSFYSQLIGNMIRGSSPDSRYA